MKTVQLGIEQKIMKAQIKDTKLNIPTFWNPHIEFKKTKPGSRDQGQESLSDHKRSGENENIFTKSLPLNWRSYTYI